VYISGTPNVSRTLIVHVGPPKTGTTTFQKELIQGKKFLSDNGVSLAMDHIKSGAYIAYTIFSKFSSNTPIDYTFVDQRKCDFYIRQLSASSPISLISSEIFSLWNLEAWTWFLQRVNFERLIVVVVHRNPLSQMRSAYSQIQRESVLKGKSKYISPFFPLYFEKNKSPFVEPVSLLETLKQLEVEIVGVSFETLLEQHMTLGEFVICNVTLQNLKWNDCRHDWLHATHQKTQRIFLNKGFSPVIWDIFSFANKIATIRNCTKFWPNGNELIYRLNKLNKHLPLIEMDMSHLLQQQTNEWFRRTKAIPPSGESVKDIVPILDEMAITHSQQELILATLGAECN